MGKVTKIQWCHHTFNGVRGCTKKRIPIVAGNPEEFHPSGCDNCYAEKMSHRNPKLLGIWDIGGIRVLASQQMWDAPHDWNEEAKRAGEQRRVFAYSLGDMGEVPMKELEQDAKLYGYDPTQQQIEIAERNQLVCDQARRRLWKLVEDTPWLDWLLLTKRIEEILGLVPPQWLTNPPKNWWQGTSVSVQPDVDTRLPELIRIPSAVRFVSAEPCLGDLDIEQFLNDEYAPHDIGGVVAEEIGPRVDWVIGGGESGGGARVSKISRLRSLANQCADNGVPFFNKQLGAKAYDGHVRLPLVDKKGGNPDEWSKDLRIFQLPEVS